MVGKVLEGKYVTLVPVDVEDAEFTRNIRRSPEFCNFFPKLDNTLEEQVAWIIQQREKPGDYFFVVRNKENNRIGTIGLYNFHGDICEAGRLTVRGNAYQSIEAQILSFDFAFYQLGVKQTVSYIFADNGRALRFSRKFGGVFSDSPILHDDGRLMIKKTTTKEQYTEARQYIAKMIYREEKMAQISDYERIVEKGKQIFLNHPEQYTKQRMDGFKKDLRRIFGDSESDRAKKAFYHAVYDYWIYGNNMREDIFYNFAQKSDEEKKEYITFRNRFNYYNFLNDPNDEMLFKKKYDTYQKFSKWYARDVIAIDGQDDYDKFEKFVSMHKTFFVKPNSLGLGIGVHKVVLNDNADLHDVFSKILDESGVSKSAAWAIGKQVVLEEPIIQCKEMAKLHPASCNMIRLTTVLVDGIVKIVDAWLRVGMNGSDIAAAAEGEIYCGVNLNTGIVETDGYTEFGNVFKKHPDTDVEFIGYVIPKWNDMIQMSEELAQVVPTVRYVGWDLALTEKGWVIIEGNENGEFLGQMIYNRPYKKWFETLINYKERQF